MRITESALRRIVREEILREAITVGDLKAALKAAKGQKNKEIALDAAKKLAAKGVEKGAESVVGLFPGGGTIWSWVSGAKDAGEIIYNAAKSDPEVKKKNPLWDRLTLDPEVSAIVDDEVEDKFIKALGDAVTGLDDDAELPDADEQLSNWLKGKYSGAHITKAT